jgi:hypothetical protein
MNKEEFIETYTQIHEKISFIEKEIEFFTQNKTNILQNPYILKDLKSRLEGEIEKLNKTREYERFIFKY